MKIFNIFSPAPYLDEISDTKEVDQKYKYWRFRVFYSMFLGYAFFYLTRHSFTFAMPAIIQDLGFSKTDLGMLITIFAVAYGFSKFISGIIGDRSNARYFMTFGLFLTGVFNILFGFTSSLFSFALCWGLNGWFQGFGWPACARLLTHWYSQNERGRWWSLWNTSHNFGGAVIPIITAFIAQYYGWRMAMIIPGVACIAMSLFLINRLCDTPQSLGLPPIEKYRNDYGTEKAGSIERELTVKEILFKYVLFNPYIWVLAISYFFIYVVRMALNTWALCYLVEAKKYTQLQAGSIVFFYDFGGIFGSLAAGFASDKIFGGRRGPINVIFSFLVVVMLVAFTSYTEKSLLIDSALIFGAGFFVYGPQMLIGMQAAEVAHKKAAATASGFCGWVAYLGSAITGYPMGRIIQESGYTSFLMVLVLCAFIAGVLMLPLWKVKSRVVEIDDEKKLAPAVVEVEK